MRAPTILFALLLINIFFVNRTIAQEKPPPITWGKIPHEHLEMKSFPSDTNASVIILCDYGESKFNNEFNIVFDRHQKVKILNNKGYDWGN